MESLDVFTQEQLEEALGRPGVIPVCSGDGTFGVTGDRFVRAADSAQVTVGDSVAIDAGGNATVVASGRADVTARDRVSVEARDDVRVRIIGRGSVLALGRARVTAGGHTVLDAAEEAFVTAQASAMVTATDRCTVRALARSRVHVSGDAQAWVWGTAVARAFDTARVSAWGSASVQATGSAVVEAREDAVVVAGGSVFVRAFGAAMVRARGRARVDAAEGVSVTRHAAGVEVQGGGVRDAPRFTSAAEWCAYYGVEVENGVATLYKAVDEDFATHHGGSYRPGTEPQADDWDGGEQECGGGLHLSPLPTLALPHPDDAMRFVACPVRLEDIAVHPNGDYPGKVKARAVCAPVYEVREDRSPIG